MLNFNPRHRYFGSITTSGFYPVVVSELWHWTGDKAVVSSLLEPMLKSLRWIDRYGDLNGDGFVEYLTLSTQGNRNQGWKDSRDGIVYADGSQVDPPIATCEEQGFVYLSKVWAAEVLWWLGDKDEARQYFHAASELKKKFNDAFWMESEGFYAMGFDPSPRRTRHMPLLAITAAASGRWNKERLRSE
jgi:glycogen debranching enzyme